MLLLVSILRRTFCFGQFYIVTHFEINTNALDCLINLIQLIRFSSGNEKIVELFLKKRGMEIDMDDGLVINTPFHYAAMSGERTWIYMTKLMWRICCYFDSIDLCTQVTWKSSKCCSMLQELVNEKLSSKSNRSSKQLLKLHLYENDKFLLSRTIHRCKLWSGEVD